MHASLLLTLLLLLAAYALLDAQARPDHPRQAHRRQQAELARRKYGAAAHRERKKDIFLSRGWGAGGMPFSVLYLNPTRATVGELRPPAAQPEAPRVAPARLQPLARSAMRGRQAASQQAIPQLFVSYNWAPMGRRK